MNQDEKRRQDNPDEAPQINHINKVEEPPRDKESERQRVIDQQLHSEALRDMHIESGEKINEYNVDKM